MSGRSPRRETRIDRLALRLSGMGEPEGRALAALVAERLAAADLGPRGAAEIESVRVHLRAGSNTAPPRLAEQIAEAIARQLGREA